MFLLNNINVLARMNGQNMMANVRSALGLMLAVRTLEPRRLATVMLNMKIQSTFLSESALAIRIRTREPVR